MDAYVRVALCELVQHPRRVVGGAVVDEDEFALSRRHALSEQGVDAGLQVTARVVHGYDNADLDHGNPRSCLPNKTAHVTKEVPLIHFTKPSGGAAGCTGAEQTVNTPLRRAAALARLTTPA
ncbi:hypothetical protein GCM10023317_18040 [Actinopolymorpha pittospori]